MYAAMGAFPTVVNVVQWALLDVIEDLEPRQDAAEKVLSALYAAGYRIDQVDPAAKPGNAVGGNDSRSST